MPTEAFSQLTEADLVDDVAAEASACTYESAEPDDTGRALRARIGLLSPAEFATLIGIDERTAAVWRNRGAGPDYVKLGRAVFYRLDDVQDWIKLNIMPCDRAA
jgi:predicted DNA-binding transcriptional regulator AlpA